MTLTGFLKKTPVPQEGESNGSDPALVNGMATARSLSDLTSSSSKAQVIDLSDGREGEEEERGKGGRTGIEVGIDGPEGAPAGTQMVTSAARQKWTCSACTFENHFSRSTCEMCSTKRHKRTTTAGAPASMSSTKKKKQQHLQQHAKGGIQAFFKK